ncbi:MAG: tRNA (adenosine(37)-N6)-threonylcarbamoyltransferase complex ATPase subunit type 1 TsaE [Planctomycetota bacterium]
MKRTIQTRSESETFEFGKRLGRIIDGPLLCFLHGTLGAGKTRLVQAVAAGLEIDPEFVNSPTFTIMVPHKGRLDLVHVDAYRINHLEEVGELGLEDFIEDGSVMMIEWAEKIEAALPKPDLKISIEHEGENSRQILLAAASGKAKKLLESL